MSDEKQVAWEKLLGFLGLCRKAGRTVLGTPMVCEELRRPKKPALAVFSSGVSLPTKKKLQNKCAFYGVPLYEVDVSPEELAHAVGKSGNLAALAVTDERMAEALCLRIKALSDSGDAGILN